MIFAACIELAVHCEFWRRDLNNNLVYISRVLRKR